MPPVRRAGARPSAAPLAVLAVLSAVLLAGCSGSTHSSSLPAGEAATTAATATPSAAPTIDAAGLRLLHRAAQVVAHTHSYSFVADTTLTAGSQLRTHVAGRVIRGRAIAYTLRARSKTTQVVRLRAATYVRAVPGPWSRLHRPHQLVNPTLTLQAVLRSLAPTAVTSGPRGEHVLHGALGAAAARAAGLPTGVRRADVAVTLDRANHVTRIDVRTSLRAGGTTVQVLLRTTYGTFGRVAPIRRPA